jgi:GT2 family glycosyltransferase
VTIAVVVVGIGGWREFSEPAIESIHQHEPDIRIVMVDNGSSPAYPASQVATIVRIPETVSYAAALNAGMWATDNPSWLLVLNNDTLALAPFGHVIASLSPTAIYGRQIIEEHGERWIGLWLMLIPRACLDVIGSAPFDDRFEGAAFEDLDFCLRAKAAGFPSEWVDLPVFHFWGKTRWGIQGFEEMRERNRKRIEAKHGWLPGVSMVVVRE